MAFDPRAHVLEELSIDQAHRAVAGGTPWVGVCACSNPDGDGTGAVQFSGTSPAEVANIWLEHVLEQAAPPAGDALVEDIAHHFSEWTDDNAPLNMGAYRMASADFVKKFLITDSQLSTDI